MTDDYGFLKDVILPFVAIVISIIAIVVSGITWQRARPIEIKQYDTSSMLQVFQYMSDDSILQAKTNVSISYWDLKDQNKKAIFQGSVEQDANKIKTAFDKTGILYELGLLDKESLLKVYDGNIVRTWKLLEEDILNDRDTNPKQCQYFEKLAKEIINSWDSNHPKSEPLPIPYRPKNADFREAVEAAI